MRLRRIRFYIRVFNPGLVAGLWLICQNMRMINNYKISTLFSKLLLAFVSFLQISCQTTHQNPFLTLLPREQTTAVVDKYSANQKIYDGFMARMDISATLHNSKVTHALLDEKARIYQWNEESYQKEKQKKSEELGKQTDVFVSVFVPERKQDDLHKASTKWKLFLDVNGKRYEGKATKDKSMPAELQILYPQHSRWGTPYKITFNVPIQEVESQKAKFTMTGPPGSSTVEFLSVTD